MIITNKGDPKPLNYKDAIYVKNLQNTIEWYFEGDAIPAIDTPPVVYSVTPRQFRQALTAGGYRATVDAAVASSDQNIQDWYEFSTSFDSNNPIMTAMAATLGFTQQQVNDLFALASTL